MSAGSPSLRTIECYVTQTFWLTVTYLAILAWIVVAVCALFPARPRTQVAIKVLFGVLALLVLAQLMIMGER